ncbi:ABC transporter permease [Selenomonadales bacterium OttesenSCG-928-I06]|nr:ABC transporter permease [Selenomonadales bacterium OttesenSCG-928-I06]
MLKKIKKNKIAFISFLTIILIILLAVFVPVITPYSYFEQELSMANSPPSFSHIFGTDNLGRDLFTRVLYGARISLAIGFFAAFLNLIVGVLYGGISGYFGGNIDNVMMRIVDIFYSIPLILYVVLLMVVLKPGLVNIFIALSIVYWLRMARIVRNQVMSLKNKEYVLAAKMLKASHFRIITKHILPNCFGPILVTATLAIPEAIFTEAFLSFVGLGVTAPMASWGVLAVDGLNSLRSYPYQLLFPSLFICITMFSFNFLSDYLRDVFDPKMK